MNLQGVAHRGFSYTRGAYCYDAVDHLFLALRRRIVAVFGCWRCGAACCCQVAALPGGLLPLPLGPQGWLSLWLQ